ncbi:hypothetical protein ACUN22_35805 [Streptomyces anulatus]|uniref:hypothetical protein n=1 Tax=Streptomyces anulatus TaxID=1892 RepID=UPI00403D8E90
MERDGQVGAVADQGQGDASGVAQAQKALDAACGEPVGAQDGEPGGGQGGDPGGGGFPRGLSACGEAAWQYRRFTQGCEEVVGESGVAGGAWSGVQGNPAGAGIVGCQGGVSVGDVVVPVHHQGDGRRGTAGGVHARRLKVQRSSS